MFCSYCGAENPDDGRFCTGCRRGLAAQRSPAGRTPGLHSPAPSTSPAPFDSLDWRDTGTATEYPGDEAAAGRLIAGRWRVEALLGRGGMGEVYRVFDQLTQRRRALKVIHPALLRSGTARERFREEAALTQELRHERIVQTFDVADDGEDFVYVMEDVDGGSLRDRIVAREGQVRSGAREYAFDVREALALVDEILEALAYAHAGGVLHRDVKPENVLLTSEGHVKLADFGLAKLVDPARLASMSQVAGTPLYMAPEQLKPKASVDQRADLYAVGVILYELLTGEVPLGRFDPVSTLRPDSPFALDAVLDKALARRAEDRIASAAEFRSALGALPAVGSRAVGPSTAGGSLATEGPVALHAETRSSVVTRGLDRPSPRASDRAPGPPSPPDSDAIPGREQAPAAPPPTPRVSSRRGRRSVAAFVVVALVAAAAIALWQRGVFPRKTDGPGVAPVGERFLSQGNGTVIDTQTGLQWAARDNGSGVDWPNAKRYTENLTLGGYSDWRLPTQDELSALLKAGKSSVRSYRPVCATSDWTVVSPVGIELSCYWYWASERRGSDATLIFFGDGLLRLYRQFYSSNGRVLPVRVRD